MTAPTKPAKPAQESNAGEWASIIQSAGQGAGSGMQSMSAQAQSKREAREAKRRTIANAMNQALKRKQDLAMAGQQYGSEMNDYQARAMQQAARGFVEALQGSTGRG